MPVNREGMREALAPVLASIWRAIECEQHPYLYRGQLLADAALDPAGPLSTLLTRADTAERMEAERDEARKERDDLKVAAGLNPGPFRSELSRKVILDDIAGMRPAMVKAREEARNVEGDALLWNMRMLEEWPGDTLLLRLWRQRREATKAAKAARAEVARLSAEVEALRAALTKIAEHPKDYDDGKTSYGMGYVFGCIQHIARTALARTTDQPDPGAREESV